MYRQIEVNESQRHLQLILWRDEETQPLKTLQLNTVTYGTASAPFLSTRCLTQLAEECSDEAVAEVIKHDFYVDDLNTGSNSKSDLKHIVKDVIQKLNEGCFPLRKFRTNSPDILDGISTIDNTQDFSKQSTVLGLKWSPTDDILCFSAESVAISKITKRNILSTSCKIFDPLGLLSACTIIPKMLLQKLWLEKTSWDEPVPDSVSRAWKDFQANIQDIANIIVPRHVLCSETVTVEAHTFTDASQDAYAACLFLKSIDAHGKITTNLLCAKARVAPLKPEMTIPRLELLGAQLGARLHDKVIKALRIRVHRSIFWSDSTIVLGWIKTQPKTLKTFVCNRIQEIRDLTGQHEWRHVPTEFNPADLGTRGLRPELLENSDLWWNGPSFLRKPEKDWPPNNPCEVTLPETKGGAFGGRK
ncbi:uncharacterized protein LOC126382259 [Pectinophora gossypiella]|uniref:uncharacterized protein LOC126382259 n=1 Tax=Pectinophora gossypiella TaxID=13191 RepID=UPI00214E8DE5|nr:uncharacterized protein LOC126382259 [Pectinophora gossypiella]